ncbi:hypothetical protein [Paraburkholderia caballeronis]|uniref:Uncharacterized protein n=1 Tax=Paraburkholderia caballeronis TaxID=416943 RepID=A0A1H7L296_9BURK|nr:hypothetical protein [Paraburkholderia caballeronis]PXW28242.1 hypothetical protein C7403_102134 [Paraburkholderia caballeronis]PXX03608.1 hypothetical protein C7407_102134 [Paraburkholderia caballeronis]RAK04352.1 hypothetical protein C7409_102134 [Paraburkholderia caballeronis]SED83706.1 hypothetical protein SAMN05445871_4045 [Paraburkholderia caballeronis]SEK92505.1 hypothetical protein SAMN05192542_104134 [Paraburkholderia caballeronis]
MYGQSDIVGLTAGQVQAMQAQQNIGGLRNEMRTRLQEAFAAEPVAPVKALDLMQRASAAVGALEELLAEHEKRIEAVLVPPQQKGNTGTDGNPMASDSTLVNSLRALLARVDRCSEIVSDLSARVQI